MQDILQNVRAVLHPLMILLLAFSFSAGDANAKLEAGVNQLLKTYATTTTTGAFIVNLAKLKQFSLIH